jgi:6-phosphogluconolactonase
VRRRARRLNCIGASRVRHHTFPDRCALARQLAADVAAAVSRRLAAHATASLVLSGGRTPDAFLRELAVQPLDWANVHVSPADERCVAVDDRASNLRLVRDAFADTPAARARLLTFDATTDDAAARWSELMAPLPRPHAAVVLGMGDDGHFASLFPGMPGLEAALSENGPRTVVRGVAPSAPRARLSLPLAALLDADLLALHIEGPAKLAMLQRASSGGRPLELPARALLDQRRVVLDVYHTP